MRFASVLSHPSRTRPGAALPGLLALVAVAILLPTSADAIECITRSLPRPAEDFEVTRARLEELGEWKISGNPLLTPPPDPQLGETWMWYVWDLGGFPVPELKPATVRGLGNNCYVVVDDEEWNVSMDQADVDRIVAHFDNQSVGDFPERGIWDLNTLHFGDPPNPLDGLDRIFLFYYRFNISADGYFWSFDQYPDGSQPFASNECDVVYLATDSSGGPPASDYMLAVGAHEFEHMIHFARDQNEAAWVDEGLGELAMWLFGWPDNIGSFNANPDNGLLDWGGAWADYIQTYLWSLYMYEQYGGQPLIWDLIHNPANSMTGYTLALRDQGFDDVSTSDIFADWGAANFLDDVTVDAGQYGYVGDELPPFHAYRTHAVFPVSASGTVQPHATDYIRLQDFSSTININFDGADNREFRLMMLGLDAEMPTIVHSVELDAGNFGSVELLDFENYDEAIMAVANVSLTGTGSYSYEVYEVVIDDVPPTIAAQTRLQCHPNPFNPRTEFSFELATPGAVRLTVHDLRGREVTRLVESAMAAGPHTIAWTPDELAAGVYVGRLAVDGREVSRRKVTIVK